MPCSACLVPWQLQHSHSRHSARLASLHPPPPTQPPITLRASNIPAREHTNLSSHPQPLSIRMAEVAEQPAAAGPARVSYLADAPPIRTLEDGTKLLAEAQAFLILEGNAHTSKCGAYANEHTVQLIREHTDSQGRPSFKLVVKPRDGEVGGTGRVLQLDALCSMRPALRRIRRETHFIKPDGESLMQAINRMDGEQVKLFAFEVRRSSPNPLLNLLRLKQSVVRLGFTRVDEALGWYVYVAACATIMSEQDPDFKKVIKPRQGLAEHAAAPHALILEMDDGPAQH